MSEIGLVVGIISSIISIIALTVTIKKNRRDENRIDVEKQLELEGRIVGLEQQLLRMIPVNDRVSIIETKIGLFWSMIEHMSMSQLVHTKEQDIKDAQVYDELRSKTPTDVLVRLSIYLLYKLGDPETPLDEKGLMILKLGSIQSQLIDRGEKPVSI